MHRKLLSYIGPHLRMPWWLFWSFLASLTWFYVVRRIIDWDLWWHMAAGRYLLDHGVVSTLSHWQTWIIGGEYLQKIGVYPDNSAFTFSPVNNSVFVSRTWLGDIIFHKIYEWGGFYGLQIFRGTLILVPVVLMLHLARWRYNVWTLLASAMMIIGTMQKHLCKNPIVSLPFMGFICWAWIQARYHGKTKWLYTFPFLFLFWSHFHGEAIVGIVLLGLIVVGEIIDSVLLPLLRYVTWKNVQWVFGDIWIVAVLIVALLIAYFTPWFVTAVLLLVLVVVASFEEALKPFFQGVANRRSNWKFLSILGISSLLCLVPVHIIWSLPLDSVSNVLTKVIPALKSEDQIQKERELSVVQKQAPASQDLKAKLKAALRTTFTGADADNVAEYQWPFEILFVLSVKAIFLLFVFYLIYIMIQGTLKGEHLRCSMEFPMIIFLYMSLGYLRTVSFTFVIALPFMAYSLTQGWPSVTIARRKWAGMILLGLSAFLILAHLAVSLFNEFNHLFYTSLGYAQILAVPFLLVPLILGVFLLIGQEPIFKKCANILCATLGLYTFACLGSFAYFENKTYQDGNFHGVTGFIDTEPGLGKSNKFFDTMADYVTQKLPPDKTIYNTYNMGGYLQWKWYGIRKVFIDGRSAIYETNFYQAYIQNNAQQYCQQHDFEHAFINLVVDKDRLVFFLQQGWTPIAYDSASTVLQRPKRQIEDVYGVLPEYILGERQISELENYDRQLLGNFINATLHHMMLFGRIKDGKDFMTQALPVIDQLQDEGMKQQLKGRLTQVEQFANAFGNINHRALAPLCKKIFENVQGLPYIIAMADTYYALQQWPQAEAHYARAYQSKKDDKNILLRLGESAYHQNKHDQALTAYQEALKLDGKDPRILAWALLPLLAQKNYDKVLAVGQDALRMNPDMPDVLFHMGIATLEKGEKSQARAYFEQCLKLKPDFKPAELKILECNGANTKP